MSVDNIFSSQVEEFEKAKAEFMDKIKGELEISNDENLEYFVSIFFDKRSVDEIDMDYVFAV